MKDKIISYVKTSLQVFGVLFGLLVVWAMFSPDEPVATTAVVQPPVVTEAVVEDNTLSPALLKEFKDIYVEGCVDGDEAMRGFCTCSASDIFNDKSASWILEQFEYFDAGNPTDEFSGVLGDAILSCIDRL